MHNSGVMVWSFQCSRRPQWPEVYGVPLVISRSFTVNTTYTIFSIEVLYNLATLCLNGPLSCVDIVDVITGDIPRKVPPFHLAGGGGGEVGGGGVQAVIYDGLIKGLGMSSRVCVTG